MKNNFEKLNNKIIKCTKCTRLVNFRNQISKNKRKKYINESYWGKPITGFGDSKAKILIVGLAPAAHGGTRTGRVFTGDQSSDFLYKCLYAAQISNQKSSLHVNDGLKLKKTFITTALKCVPPKDKPLKTELNNCFHYFNNEIYLLKKIKVVVALGKIAFDACVQFYKKKNLISKKLIFVHGKSYKLKDGKILLACYHPSPRNVNTKRINFKKMKNLFIKAKSLT